MSYIKEKTIKEVKERIDIIDVISDYVRLEKTGSSYKGLCPFHNEKTPSMIVTPSKNLFHCFGCGEGGDGIAFVSKIKNLTFNETITLLADKMGIEVELGDNKDKKENILYDINREAAIYFYKNLLKNPFPMNYLKNRKITLQSIKNFGIGYANDSWDDLTNYLRKKFKEEDIIKSGLISKGNTGKIYDKFRNRIIFPIFNINNKIIGFGGRTLSKDKTQPKYLNSPETEVFIKGHNLYGINKSKNHIRNNYVVLVEGYMDYLSLIEAKIDNVVAVLGTALTNKQVSLIKNYTENIVLMYDSDEAGLNATKKAIDVCKMEGISTKVVRLKDGLDPDDYIKIYGREMILNKIEEAKHYMEFLLDIDKSKLDLNKLEDRIKYSKNSIKKVSTLENNIEIEAFLDAISNDTKIDKDVLREELSKSKKFKYDNNSIKKKTSLVEPSVEKNVILENECLRLLLENTELIDETLIKLNMDDFTDECNREIYSKVILKEKKSDNIRLEWEDIIKRLEVIENMDFNIASENSEKALEDYIKKIKINSLFRKKSNIIESMKNIDETDNITEKILIKNLSKIESEIKKFKSKK